MPDQARCEFVPVLEGFISADRIWGSPIETELAVRAMNFFLETYLKAEVLGQYVEVDLVKKRGMFDFDAYYQARGWLSTYRSLAACLKVKYAINPRHCRHR